MLRIGIDVSLGLQTVQISPYPLLGHLSHQAVGRQLIQPQFFDPPAAAAPQNLDNKSRAHIVTKSVPDPLDTGEDHLSGNCDVRFGVNAPAAAAVFAALRVGLAEVVQNTAPKTPAALAIIHHCPQPAHFQGVRLTFLSSGEKRSGCGHIAVAVEKDTVRRLAVPPGTTRLLIIGLQILGHIVVDDKADVGLVNTHAKGIGSHHDLTAVKLKAVLIAPPLLFAQSRVIPGDGKAMDLQLLADPLHGGAGGAVNHAAFSPPLVQQCQKRRKFFPARTLYVKKQVRPVKACYHPLRVLQTQPYGDIPLHPGSRRGCKGRQHRPSGQRGHERRNTQIAGPEVLSPLRDAVRLIHRHQRNVQRSHKLLESLVFQPLRRHIQQTASASPQHTPHPPGLLQVLGAVKKGGRDPCRFQRRHLVLHQRDQR